MGIAFSPPSKASISDPQQRGVIVILISALWLLNRTMGAPRPEDG